MRSEGDAERLVGGGEGGKEGAQSDIGGNRHTSYTSKVNNFKPLLTTWLFLVFFILLANQH